MATGIFYTISKRNNSTLVPTGAGVNFDIYLKESESLLRPVFRMQNAARPTWNYVLYEGRYYFIRDIICVRDGLWELSCECDVLATYKAQIQATNAFVLYASGSNSEIVDQRLSVKTTATHAASPGAGFPHVTKYGKYILTITGWDTTSAYVCSHNDVLTLFSAIRNWSNIHIPKPAAQVDVPAMLKDATDSIIDALRQVIATGSAGEHIKSATFVPLSDGAYSGKTQDQVVYMGDYNTGLTLPAIVDRHFAESINIAIPWQAADWRRNAPYHEIYLVIPTLGVIALSPSDLIGCDSLNVELEIDIITGEAKIVVYAGGLNRQIGIYGVNYGAQYPIGASNVTPMDVTSNVLGGVATGIAALASGGAAAAVIGTKWIAGTLNNLQPMPSTIGGNAGNAAIGADVRCWIYTIFHDTVVAPASVSAVMGVPQMKTMTLRSISGYVQTQNASVAGAMTSEERQLINAMLDGGIYIE